MIWKKLVREKGKGRERGRGGLVDPFLSKVGMENQKRRLPPHFVKPATNEGRAGSRIVKELRFFILR